MTAADNPGTAPDFDPTDPTALTAALVRCPSVTPEEGGALALLERVLAPSGVVPSLRHI